MSDLKTLSKALHDEVNKLRAFTEKLYLADSDKREVSTYLTEVEMLCGDITLAVNKQEERVA